MALLIVGGTVVDLIFPHVPRLPGWPEHTEFTADNLVLLREAPLVTIGGNGANAAYVASRCGASTRLHSNIGQDALGSLARRWLTDSGCSVMEPSPAAPSQRRTAVNVTAANLSLQRATLFFPGDPPSLPPPAPDIAHLLVCGWPHPGPAELARNLGAWRASGARTAIDFGPILDTPPTLSSLRPVLDELDLFIANEHELLSITADAELAPALKHLRATFSGDIVIKRGAAGVTWVPRGEPAPQSMNGQDIQAVNTVGAGDTFNGGLLAALDRGAPLTQALRFADQTACSVVCSAEGVLGVKPPPWPPV